MRHILLIENYMDLIITDKHSNQPNKLTNIDLLHCVCLFKKKKNQYNWNSKKILNLKRTTNITGFQIEAQLPVVVLVGFNNAQKKSF